MQDTTRTTRQSLYPASYRPMTFSRLCLLILISSTICVRAVDLPKTASLAPPDTVVLVDIPDVTQLTAQLEKTPAYRLYKDPAMQPFVEDIRAKIRDAVGESEDQFVKTIYNADVLPTGRAALALVLNKKAIDANEPMGLFVLQWGENLPKISQALDKIVEKALEKGARRSSEDYRGANITTITLKEPSGDSEESSTLGGGFSSIFNYCFLDDCLIASDDIDLIKFAVARIKGLGGASLADEADYNSSLNAVGPHHDIDLYVNIKHIIRTYTAQDDAGRLKTMLTNLGVDNVASLAASVALARGPAGGSSGKALLKIDGQKKGLCKMLEIESAPVRVPKFVSADACSLTFANFNIKSAFDILARIVQSFSPQAAAIMHMPIIPPSPDGQPGLIIKADIIDHLGSQILAVRDQRPPAPPKDIPVQQGLFAVATSNRSALDGSLSRLHGLFTQGDPDATRRLLGYTMYLVDLSAFLPAFMPGPPQPGAQPPSSEPAPPALVMPTLPTMALAVTDTHLIVGVEAAVERAIRTLADPGDKGEFAKWFNKAKAAIPDTVGFAALQNNAAYGEFLWKTFKATAEKATTTEQDSSRSIGIGLGSSGLMFSQQGIKAIDTKLLPEFDAVRKYFGLAASYAVSRPDGFFFESKYLSPD